NPATATDADFADIESVVGHEYFHNWTGDRVTCRDWFQLSLKEGLTVFRDQEFSMDLAGSPSARAVKRIEDVRVLRTVQFAEDAGPMAHPVRPDSYIEINNFYTATVYEKGAEVVRMMQTLTGGQSDPFGREGFAKGLSLYFERHDGHAVTCDDFAQAIADANPGSALAERLPQFKRWYAQAGTPRVQATAQYDAAARRYTLTLSQSCAATPGQPAKEPFVIPVTLGLVGPDGAALPLRLEGEAESQRQGGAGSRTLVLAEPRQSFTFEDVAAPPVPSLLRGFSAPVRLECDYSDAELLTLLAHDPDPFNRWEAGQRLALRIAINNIANNEDPAFVSAGFEQNILPDAFVSAMREVLRHPKLDAAFKELALTLPSETYIAEQLDVVDPQRVHAVREAMREQLALALQPDWIWAWEQHSHTGSYRPDPESAGRRALAGLALGQLCLAANRSGDPVWPGRAYQRFKDAGNMTDRFNALAALVAAGQPLAARALALFHQEFRHEALVLDKWFALQGGSPDRDGNVLPAVRQLMQHPDFNLRNPNRARSLIFSYCSANPGAFHRRDAAGYRFWSERVAELDAFNPQVAARLARALDRWRKLAEPYRGSAREAIARVAAKPDLSNDVREVVTRALADADDGPD
ncbi:MAG: aminopeptidase N, partial [Proteobacteria bacterium]|nr:aminopeptidase N [Pseudomonadota bacterium]